MFHRQRQTTLTLLWQTDDTITIADHTTQKVFDSLWFYCIIVLYCCRQKKLNNWNFFTFVPDTMVIPRMERDTVAQWLIPSTSLTSLKREAEEILTRRANKQKRENRKRICNFLLAISSNFGRISSTVFEISTRLIGWKSSVFFLPLCHSAPPLPVFPLEFRGEVNHEETRVIGLLCGEGRMILTSTVFDRSTHVTDGRTDRKTDGDSI